MKNKKSKIDLYVHSRFSGDTNSDPEEMILRAIELNLNGVAFTEHYSYEASEPVENLKENQMMDFLSRRIIYPPLLAFPLL